MLASWQKKFMAAPWHAFVVFSMLFWWRQCICWCTGLLSTLYCRNTILVFMLLKNEDKRKQTGRKYSTPPCISIAGPGPPLELKVSTPGKRSITLSWKKPQGYGDDVQMYTVISLLLLFVASLLSLSLPYKLTSLHFFSDDNHNPELNQMLKSTLLFALSSLSGNRIRGGNIAAPAQIEKGRHWWIHWRVHLDLLYFEVATGAGRCSENYCPL